ncbi:hypothetical protein THOM_0118 [Trachipleistophora hominis]|uniref:Uncharacterized protein n=1 Tax=Trachipleistophora hominis TaxID=72359 RepID=L7K0D4_TRAHO|nr:hypothetical protein THOM_0118 [Trachipleistophora hominis]
MPYIKGLMPRKHSLLILLLGCSLLSLGITGYVIVSNARNRNLISVAQRERGAEFRDFVNDEQGHGKVRYEDINSIEKETICGDCTALGHDGSFICHDVDVKHSKDARHDNDSTPSSQYAIQNHQPMVIHQTIVPYAMTDSTVKVKPAEPNVQKLIDTQKPETVADGTSSTVYYSCYDQSSDYYSCFTDYSTVDKHIETKDDEDALGCGKRLDLSEKSIARIKKWEKMFNCDLKPFYDQ